MKDAEGRDWPSAPWSERPGRNCGTGRAILPQIETPFMSGYPSDVIAKHGVLNKGVDFPRSPSVLICCTPCGVDCRRCQAVVVEEVASVRTSLSGRRPG